MLFNSVNFLVFFPTVTLIYFLLPYKVRWILLLIASCMFYMAFIPQYIFVIIFLIIVDYFAGLIIEKSRGQKRNMALLMSIIANVGILSFFKYFNFFLTSLGWFLKNFGFQIDTPYLSLLLPLGLSFHVFQSMSYTIEVYKGRVKAEKNLGIYALYVLFYPQLVAGPIERPDSLIPQLKKNHKFDADRIFNGIKLMLWGFFKKVVIADRLALIVNPIYGNPSVYSGGTLILATYAFAFQILCDFGGYTDIALGAAQVMGFNLRGNFNYPYLATSISDFWRRWHMSLSTWFRDYLYIPLGGNRVSRARWIINILIVFIVSGLWHGADWKFVLWGAVHGVFIVFESLLKYTKIRINRLLSIFVTFNLVSFAWIFFRAQSTSDAFSIITIVAKDLTRSMFDLNILSTYNRHIVFLGATLIISTVVILLQGTESFRNLLSKFPLVVRWGVCYLLILSIIFLGVFSETKFIYFQF